MASIALRNSGIQAGDRYLLLAASVMTCLLVAMGGIVCATESGTGCPDWPGCYGHIVPPAQVNAVIEFTHRLAAALTSPLILAAAAVSWRRGSVARWVRWPLALSLVFLLAVVLFGRAAVLTGLPRGLAAVDLGSALIVLALVLTATTVALTRRDIPAMPDRLSLRSGLARLSLAALVAVFAVHVSGVLVAGAGSLTRCLGWPMWRLLPADVNNLDQVARLIVAAVAVCLIVALVVAIRRSKPRRGLGGAAVALATMLVLEMGLSAVMLVAGTNPYLLVLYAVAATLLWASLIVVTVLVCATAGSQVQSPNPATS